VVKFFILSERRRFSFWEDKRMDRRKPVDEARAPGFTTGLILDAPSGRKSTDQRIPSGHAIARILPPFAGWFLRKSPDQRFPGNRKENSGDVAEEPHPNIIAIGRPAGWHCSGSASRP
jgi:hypothetical protein